jgi:hypothetical protein
MGYPHASYSAVLVGRTTITDYSKPIAPKSTATAAQPAQATANNTPAAPAARATPTYANYAAIAASGLSKPTPAVTRHVAAPPPKAQAQPQTQSRTQYQTRSAESRPRPRQFKPKAPAAKHSFRWVTDAEGFKSKVLTISTDGGKAWVDKVSEEVL